MSFNKSILPLLFFSLLIHSCASDVSETADQSKAVHKIEIADGGQIAEAKVDALLDTTPSAEEVNAAKELEAERLEQERIEKKEQAKEARLKREQEARRKKRREKRKAAKIALEKEAANAKINETKAVPVEVDYTSTTSKKSSSAKPFVQFHNTLHDYGKIEQGDKIEYKFKFRNTGKSELVITDATATCGCTKPSYPFIPIGPGEQGYIGVIFDSKGKLGRQKPAITVTTNADPATYTLYLEGFVNSPKEEEQKGEEKEENNF